MISELNSVLFCCFQLVHIILFMSVLGSEVTFVGAALGRPQNDSKYMIPINLIASMSDSINSKRKRTTRIFRSRYTLLKKQIEYAGAIWIRLHVTAVYTLLIHAIRMHRHSVYDYFLSTRFRRKKMKMRRFSMYICRS